MSRNQISIRLSQYSVHSSPPCSHSYARPSVRIVSSVVINMVVMCGGLVFMLHGVGSNSTISKSNRINRMATRKN